MNFNDWIIMRLNHEIKMHYLILESEKRERELKKELLQPKKKNRTPNIGLFQVARLVITQNDVV